MSLDPVFVAEFAQAGFLGDIPASDDAQFTDNIVAPAVQASTWQGKLVAAPFWANTQLLWYRKSVAAKAGLDMSKPVTWDEVIAAAKKTGTTVGVQADQYEGYTVWINALVASAGGQILENPGASANDTKLGLDSAAGRTAAKIIAEVAAQGVGGPALSTEEETQALDQFQEPGASGFLVNWPYTWAALGSANFRDISDVGWTQYPQAVAGTTSHPPFGGIEIGISKYSKNQQFALDATKCITSEKSQTEYMVNSGNPAANKDSYNDPAVQKLFPMAALIRSSLDVAAPRPQSQFYGDLSGALQKSFSPPSNVNQGTPAAAQKFILQVIKGEKLL